MNDMNNSFKVDRTKYKDIKFVSYLLYIIVLLKLSSNRGNKTLINFLYTFSLQSYFSFFINKFFNV